MVDWFRFLGNDVHHTGQFGEAFLRFGYGDETDDIDIFLDRVEKADGLEAFRDSIFGKKDVRRHFLKVIVGSDRVNGVKRSNGDLSTGSSDIADVFILGWEEKVLGVKFMELNEVASNLESK